MNINFIDLKRQQTQIRNNIDNAINNVLDNGQYIMGKECKELEQELADYVGMKYCLTCANGTDALRLAMLALGLKKGEMVLTTDFTFFATAEVIAELGAIPIFVDVDETYNICVKDLEEKIKLALEKGYPIKGIVSVDLFGLPADHVAINRLANKYELWHIEDGAQGFGGKINDKVACSFGDIATTSFFPAKPLGCYGDGGAIFTDNDEYTEMMNSLRVHGKGSHKYENVRIGYNSRLDTIQAAVLLEKLKIFDEELIQKKLLADTYTKAFISIPEISTPIIPKGFDSSWAQYTLKVDDRDSLMGFLKNKGIPSVVYYPTTMNNTKALLPYSKYQLPMLKNSSNFSKKVISLPMHAYLENDEVELIISSVCDFYK